MTVWRVLSIWQPYASLAIQGHKEHETRAFEPPSTIKAGERFLIASTKQVKPPQIAVADNPRMLRHCGNCGLPPWRELPFGCILGSVVLDGWFPITADMLVTVTDREYLFGDWRVGRYGWRLRDPIEFATPIPVRGGQGVWIYDGELPE